MNELDHRVIVDEISIVFHFTDGERLTQILPIDRADVAQNVIDWFKDAKGSLVWIWSHQYSANIQMIPRSKIVFIEILGYIQPNGQDSKWYQRLIDKYKIWRMM